MPRPVKYQAVASRRATRVISNDSVVAIENSMAWLESSVS